MSPFWNLEGHSCLATTESVYIFGGRNSDGNYSNALLRIWKEELLACMRLHQPKLVYVDEMSYTTEMIKTSTKVENVIPPPRAYHTTNLIQPNRFVLFGGVPLNYQSHDLYECEILDPGPHDTNQRDVRWIRHTTAGDIPSVRCHHTTSVLRSQTFVLHGGYPLREKEMPFDCENPSRLYKNEELQKLEEELYLVYTLDLTTLVWTRVDCSRDTPKPLLWGHTAVPYLGTNMIIFGGVNVSREISNEDSCIVVWNLDRKAFRWVRMNRSPDPRALHTAIYLALSDSIPSQEQSSVTVLPLMIVFGGFSDQNTSKVSDVWAFNLSEGKWLQWTTVPSPGSKAPKARSGHSAVGFDNRYMFLYGGVGADSQVMGGTIHVLDFVTHEWKDITMGKRPHTSSRRDPLMDERVSTVQRPCSDSTDSALKIIENQSREITLLRQKLDTLEKSSNDSQPTRSVFPEENAYRSCIIKGQKESIDLMPRLNMRLADPPYPKLEYPSVPVFTNSTLSDYIKNNILTGEPYHSDPVWERVSQNACQPPSGLDPLTLLNLPIPSRFTSDDHMCQEPQPFHADGSVKTERGVISNHNAQNCFGNEIIVHPRIRNAEDVSCIEKPTRNFRSSGFRGPSLRKLLRGEASMLSLTHVDPVTMIRSRNQNLKPS